MRSANYQKQEIRLQEVKKIYLNEKNAIRKRRREKKKQKSSAIKTFVRVYNVNYKSLLQRINESQSRFTRLSTNERLNKAQYAVIYEYIDRLNQAEISSISKMLKKIANEILKRNHQNSKSFFTVSKDWVYRFIKKHFRYYKRKMKIMNSKKSDAKRISNLRIWFEKLNVLIEDHEIQDENIYNINETDFCLEHERDENVITDYSKRQLKIKSEFTRTLMMTIECIEIDEKMISSFIIMSEKKQMINWFVHSICMRIYIFLMRFFID